MESVGEILSDKGGTVYAIGPEASVLHAVEEMCERRVGALLVTADGSPLGVFSERDLMTRVILARRDPASTQVADVMTRDVLCIEPGTRARSAMAVMTERRCRHLPVVEGGRVIGILSIGDLVRWASREQEFELKMLTDYVRGAY